MEDFDWEIGNDFTFEFELGLSPTIEVNPSKEDKLTKYQIVVSKEIIDREVENYAKRHGQYVDSDAVADFTEKLVGYIVQLGDDGLPLENGLSAEETSILLSLIKSEELKKPFENIKIDDVVVFNLSDTFSNEWEIASILKKDKKEEVGDISGFLFGLKVKSIQRFVNAELNQELFDKVFGEGSASNIEEFEDIIRKQIANYFDTIIMSKFKNDMHDYLLEKVDPKLPEEFLRKWITTTNKEATEEVIEQEFPHLIKRMKWDLISNSIVKQHNLVIEDHEIIEQAKAFAKEQFARYGVANIPDDSLSVYAMNYLKEEKNKREIISNLIEHKVALTVCEKVNLIIQEVTMDDFEKICSPADNTSNDVVDDNPIS